ncbi:RusA family crossover junction endodeoxyribonuclease [Ruminococcus sp. 210702-SL.1.03]|uniref:RusA family crossover junction endodeoxyribonuclease n=1 Tax=Ruminococcus sp. 210702-SL.1.03 TaxID=2883233 RepID=UPI001D08BFE8|nr:RusA family crossover junction endodeoxyribonuclease [Ruminococcus sp. 210702-SL.1.03]MCB6617087.1 RusA family crossover junction endodeoxyribonuclease [Ruminococcus sp. 210702-SL.1.03]
MRSTEFFMPMIPPTVTAQEHKVTVRNGKPIFYDPPEVKAAEEKLVANLCKHRPDEPYREGVRLTVKWLFPRGRHRDGEYRTTKPDTDNLQKLLKDCMTICGFWADDALVASEICEKFWADKAGIYVRIEELSEL